MLCAIDVETSGLIPGRHEILQLGLYTEKAEFLLQVKALHPEWADPESLKINGLNPEQGVHPSEAVKMLDHWWETNFGDLTGFKLEPLGHNAGSFDMPMVRALLLGELGPDLGFKAYDRWFSYRIRDTAVLALALQDAGRITTGPSLDKLVARFGLRRSSIHNALEDARLEYAVYKKLVHMISFPAQKGDLKW